MNRKKSGLGRGLEALLSTASAPRDAQTERAAMRHLPVDKIQRGQYQPRIHIREEALEDLANSIRAQGLVQPVVVRPVGNQFELIAGERRWRAAQLAGLQEIPAVVRDIPDQAAAAMSLIENIQRENLNPLEESMALKRLIDEFGLTHQQTAESVGRSRVAVTNLLRLLELEQATKTLLDEGRLEMGHARALLALTGNEQIAAAKHVAEKGLSVRETERYVKHLQARQSAKPTESKKRSPDVLRLENDLSETLGAPVQVLYDNRGKGRLVISYNSLDELDGILAHIK
jgi:ParB family chromosome partitioning protein